MTATRTVLRSGMRANGDRIEHILRVDPDAERDAVVFVERHRFDDSGDYTSGEYGYGVGAGADALRVLGPDVEATFGERYAAGDLDPTLAPGRSCDRVRWWFRSVGLRCEPQSTWSRVDTLWEAGDCRVDLSFSSGWGGSPSLGEWHGRDNLYQVHLRPEAHTALLALGESLGGSQDGPPDDRMVAAWRAAGAQWRPGRPGAIRDQIAEWLRAAQIAFVSYGTSWTETLVKTYRENTDCVVTLSVRVDPDPDSIDTGVTFLERFDYLPQAGDAGRDYVHSARAPYADLERLADALGEGTGTSGDRLVAGLHARTASGALDAQRPSKANRDDVAAWFREAGAHVETDDSVWINSDW